MMSLNKKRSLFVLTTLFIGTALIVFSQDISRFIKLDGTWAVCVSLGLILMFMAIVVGVRR